MCNLVLANSTFVAQAEEPERDGMPAGLRGITFRSAVPKQAAADIARSVAFYEQMLGFARTFVLDDDAAVARGAVEIHLWRCADTYIAENTACRVNVEGIEAPFDEYRPKGVIHPDGALENEAVGDEGIHGSGPRWQRHYIL